MATDTQLEGTGQAPLTLNLGSFQVPITTTPKKLFGVVFDASLTFAAHEATVSAQCATVLGRISRIRPALSVHTARQLVCGAVLSKMLYGVEAYATEERFPPTVAKDTFGWVHRQAALLTTEAAEKANAAAVAAEAGMRPLQTMVDDRCFRAAARLLSRPRDCPLRLRLAAPAPSQPGAAGYMAGNLPTVDDFRAYVDVIEDKLGLDGYQSTVQPTPNRLPFTIAEASAAARIQWNVAPPGGLKKPKCDNGSPLTDAQKRPLRAANIVRFRALARPAQFLWTDGAAKGDSRTGGVTIAPKGGWGAILQGRDGAELRRQFGRAPKFSCSYGSELAGLEGGLQMAVDEPSSLPLHVLVDAQGPLACLRHRGPLAQLNDAELRVWALLLKLAAHRVVTLSFVFSHVDWDLQDAVDALATEGLHSEDAGASKPVWWRDVSRYASVCTHRVDSGKLRRATKSWRGRFISVPTPPIFIPNYWVSKTFTRMRTGIDPGLGGHLHLHADAPQDSCPLCTARIARGTTPNEHAVQHFLQCPSDVARELRRTHFGSDDPLEPGRLWRKREANDVDAMMAYRIDFGKARQEATGPRDLATQLRGVHRRLQRAL